MTLNALLRRLHPDDSPDVLAAFLSDEDMHRQGEVRSLQQAQEYVERLNDDDGPHRAWSVTKDRVLVGLVVVTVDADNLNGWFWYWMNAAHRRQGTTSRAAVGVANWALSEGGLHRLELGHRSNNPASGAVARAAGFVQEGIEREKFLMAGRRVDALTYGRLRSDPWPTRAPLAIA